jgi:polysaccharide export outer membrane protein
MACQTGAHVLLLSNIVRRGWHGLFPAGILLCVALVCFGGCAAVYETGITVQPPINRLTDNGLVSGGGEGIVTTTADYRINLGDVINIKFPRRPAYSDTVTVRPDGKISTPLLGSVLAAGRTSDQLQRALISNYRQLFRSAPPPSQRRYLLQVGDLLDIRFSFSPDMNSEVTVRGDGHISLPVVGDIVAENKTTVALQTELTRLYTDHVSNASLVVIVKESQSNVYEHNGIVRPAPDPGLMELSVNVTKTVPLLVYVGGEVPAPGIQPFIANTSALQAIYTAGGPTPTADMRSVVILRRGKDDTAVRVVINLNADLAGERTDNMMLQPFDVVIVPRSTIALFGDTLDQYVYRTLRPVANSSVGFFFTKQVGTFNQDTHTIP